MMFPISGRVWLLMVLLVFCCCNFLSVATANACPGVGLARGAGAVLRAPVRLAGAIREAKPVRRFVARVILRR